jgi:hypothetical protein
VLRLRPIPRVARHPTTGEEKWYYGLPTILPDGRNPVEETIHAAKVGMLLHEKGISVPLQYALISDYGAEEIIISKNTDGKEHVEETGNPISGMEHECVELLLVTEIIPGETLEHICDPDGLFRNTYIGSYRKRDSVEMFFTNYKRALYDNVWHAIERNPLMKDWDMDTIMRMFEREVSNMHDCSKWQKDNYL